MPTITEMRTKMIASHLDELNTIDLNEIRKDIVEALHEPYKDLITDMTDEEVEEEFKALDLGKN